MSASVTSSAPCGATSVRSVANGLASADRHLARSYVDRFEVGAAGELLEFFESARDALDFAHDVADQTRHPAEIFDARNGLALLIVDPSPLEAA
jgi:hypothetical protein